MRNIISCIVDSVERDLESQRKMDRMSAYIEAETVRIGFSNYLNVKVFHSGYRWFCEAVVICGTDSHYVVAQNNADISVRTVDGSKYVPHWGRVKEIIRDTISPYCCNY